MNHVTLRGISSCIRMIPLVQKAEYRPIEVKKREGQTITGNTEIHAQTERLRTLNLLTVV